VLISALPDLPDAHALIVGDALFGEEAYKHSLLALAEQLGVADRIHWLGYRLDVPQLMRVADVVVHTSTAPEPFGRVIVEGVLAGRPVLVTDHGASRELLGDETGWLVPPENPQALARAIRDVLSAPAEEIAAKIQAGRERAMRLFTLPAMMRGIDTVMAHTA
jgi:glycosyltransferase involved in cell wall biosynthesis